MDLSTPEAVCAGVEDGCACPIESDYGREAKKRLPGCTYARRSVTVQLVPRVLRHAGRVRGPSQTAALPCAAGPYVSAVQEQNSGLLIESGIAYDTNRLHQKKYFADLLQTSPHIPEELKRLLAFNRMQIQTLQRPGLQVPVRVLFLVYSGIVMYNTNPM